MTGLPSLQIQRLDERAKLPVYATDGAGAFDVHALITPVNSKAPSPGMVTIPPGGHHLFHTGLAVAVPEHFMLAMNIRSGLGARYGLRLRNTIGYIDSDYRGELMVCLENAGTTGYIVTDGDRIAQCAVVAAPQFTIEEVVELPPTLRGTGGFGSTGAA